MDWVGQLRQMQQSQGGGDTGMNAYQGSMGVGNRPFAPGLMTGFGQTPDTAPAPQNGPGAGQTPPPYSPQGYAPQKQQGGSGASTGASQQYDPSMMAGQLERIMQALTQRSQQSQQQRIQTYRRRY